MNDRSFSISKQVFLTVFFVFILVILLPLTLTFGIKYLPGDVQPSLTNTEKIYGLFTLSQSFISPRDNLSGIGVSIKNPNFGNKEDATVKIYDENNNLARTVILNGRNIADGKFVKIFFNPIVNSNNKKFSWSISSVNSKFEDALEIFLTDKKPEWSKGLKVGEKLTLDSLSYITLHKVKTSTEVLNLITSDWLKRFWEDKGFFISYLLIILSLIGMIIIFSKFQSQSLRKF